MFKSIIKIYIYSFVLIPILFFFETLPIKAQTCDNRYLILVNPVRGRNLWIEKSVQPLKDQYQEINNYGYKGTWLLQYDAVVDEELLNELSNFNDNQEIGVFLEVSPRQAQDSRVVYPHAVAWDDPDAIFLSGYSQSERRRLIDKLFSSFYFRFGFYPKSVGAWWIDSYSLSYIEEKFNIDTVLIVADQKSTDDYGIWGQWWGVPYRPREENILIPADSEKKSADYVVIQWAQRDFSMAYGDGLTFSNYSLQANDYTERGLDTNYFVNLVQSYLDCKLPVGQITVGLETGIESVKSFPEYRNQLKELSNFDYLKSLTMSEFGRKYMDLFSVNPPELELKKEDSEWILTASERKNDFLGDEIVYQTGLSFSDYFVPDKSKFLDRRLPIEKSLANEMKLPIFGSIAYLVSFVLYKKKSILKYYIPISLFIFILLLPLYRSFSANGWHVYYGPVVDSIPAYQFFIPVLLFFCFAFILPFIKKLKRIGLFIWLLSLSFSLDYLILILRYTKITGISYIGVMLDPLKFMGVSIGEKFYFVVKDFSPVIAGSMIKFKPEYIWDKNFYYFFLYPLTHLIIAFIIFKILIKFPDKLKKIIFLTMSALCILYIYWIFRLDPRIVN